jgi:general secretion pathway protein D
VKPLHPSMKVLPILLASLAAQVFAQDAAETPDPTRSSARMKAALMAGGAYIPEMTVKGIVLSASRESGCVIFEATGGGRVLARPGTPFNIVVDGESRKLVIKRISSEGIEVEAPDQKEAIVLPSFGPVGNQRGGLPGEVDYVEFRDLPLLDALRMLSDQTGRNYSASVDANKISVNVMLRNVSANSVVEEICKSHGLYFKRDENSGILRIMTVGEFEKDLVGFREEQTAVFTLKYPNVPEIATAIADLFGDRVQLALNGEDHDEDALLDLEGRFDRFDTLTQRTQNANAFGGNVVGSNVNGFAFNGGLASGLGGTSGGGRSGFRSDERRNRTERRNERTGEATSQADEERFRNLTPEQAERVALALAAEARGGQGAADIEALRRKPATIYVSGSRRTNMVVVRTADARALEDIRTLVHRMDVQTPMVLLEVKVLSIELGRGFESAFEYQISDGRIGASFTTGAINPSVAVHPITGVPTNVIPLPGIGSTGLRDGQFVFQYLGETVRARLQLLETKNRVKTIATPTLLTSNNEVSRLFLGEERPLVRGINSQTIITDNNVATTPNTTTEFRNVGNTLLITPNINSDRTVTLRLVQENSFISPNGASIPVVTTGRVDDGNNNNNNNNNETGVQNVPVDVVGTRSVSGTFIAKDGMAVAIGGLIEERDIDRRSQVPILGDIPGLGLLFRRQSTEKSRRELVIILRPYVMSTPADSERLTREVLDRLAPASMERLADEGFLPPVAKPHPASELKQTIPSKKTPRFR